MQKCEILSEIGSGLENLELPAPLKMPSKCDWLVHLALGPFLDAYDEDEEELYSVALKVIKGSPEDAHAYEERLTRLTFAESSETGELLKALREAGITLEPERCAAAFALALGKTSPISFTGGTTVRPRAPNDTPWPLTLTPYSASLHRSSPRCSARRSVFTP